MPNTFANRTSKVLIIDYEASLIFAPYGFLYFATLREINSWFLAKPQRTKRLKTQRRTFMTENEIATIIADTPKAHGTFR